LKFCCSLFLGFVSPKNGGKWQKSSTQQQALPRDITLKALRQDRKKKRNVDFSFEFDFFGFQEF